MLDRPPDVAWKEREVFEDRPPGGSGDGADDDVRGNSTAPHQCSLSSR